jgi:hypothetical protein
VATTDGRFRLAALTCSALVLISGDQRAAVHLGVGDGAGVGDLLDGCQPRDPRRRRQRQLRGLAGEGLPAGGGQQVGAQAIDLRQQPGLGGGGQSQHRDDGGGADGDAERRQRRPQRPGAEPDAGHACLVADPQPRGDEP